MKKCLAAFTFCFMFVIFGVTSVFAATQTVVNDKNYSIESNKAKTYTAISASYNTAIVTATIDAVTAGTAKSSFAVYRYDGSKYVLKQSKILSITRGTCNRSSLGYVGYGTWSYTNFAKNMSTGEAYAGWSGQNMLQSD